MRVKKLWWYTTFGVISIEETLYRKGTVLVRGFCERMGVSCRGVSLVLLRVVVDLGADDPFARAGDNLHEHYGLELVLRNGKAMLDGERLQANGRVMTDGVGQVIAQIDGSMVPVAEVDAEADDRCRGKVLKWQEIRLCVARCHGRVWAHYGGNFSGKVEQAGRHLYDCARRAGFRRATAVHVVGDGAGWISRQVEDRFGRNGSFLVDFIHLSDSLSVAGKSVCGTARQWLRCQQARLKENRAAQVLAELRPRLESSGVDEDDAPVRKAYRYLRNRLDQVDYHGALQKGLPIGSVQVDSGHRHLIQARLKRTGTW